MAAHAILLTPRHSNSCKNSTREKRHKWQISIFWKITSTNIRFFKNLKLFGVAFFCCALIGTYLVMGLSWHTLSYRFRYLLERLQSLRRGDINWHWKWTKITVPLFCQFCDITTWNIDKSFCQLGIRTYNNHNRHFSPPKHQITCDLEQNKPPLDRQERKMFIFYFALECQNVLITTVHLWKCRVQYFE